LQVYSPRANLGATTELINFAPKGAIRHTCPGREAILIQPTTSRLHLILSQLIDLYKMPSATGKILPHPRLRNFVLDVLAEGRRKNIVHLMIEADITPIKSRLAERRAAGEPVSITSYVAKSFACAIDDDKRMQAYRLGKSHLVVFDDIDLAFMIEREWEGESLPVFTIVRAAQRKTAQDIHRELQAAREAPLGMQGPLNALEMWLFRLPTFLRKMIWFWVRRNPHWFKAMAGTAGVTSIGMFATGAAIGLPVTPMTVTLCIGPIEKKLALLAGKVVEREMIHLTISVDHNTIDGAPVVRFAERLKEIVFEGRALTPAPRQTQD
jgi:hypothetical protein